MLADIDFDVISEKLTEYASLKRYVLKDRVIIPDANLKSIIFENSKYDPVIEKKIMKILLDIKIIEEITVYVPKSIVKWNFYHKKVPQKFYESLNHYINI
jgi:hypothetical protein